MEGDYSPYLDLKAEEAFSSSLHNGKAVET